MIADESPSDSLFARSPRSNVVAVERFGDREMRLYVREAAGVREYREGFIPWLVVPHESAVSVRFAYDRVSLRGSAPLSTMLRFNTWTGWRDAHDGLRDMNHPFVAFRSPVEQFFVQSGHALFTGMEFDQILRAQIDIETLGLNPTDPKSDIILIAATINGADPVVFRADELGESGVITALAEWIQTQDPDVIEGHNIFNFDIPFLATRARRYGMYLEWGRDGSHVRRGQTRRFKAGARSIPYDPAYVYGRHVVDTYQQIQRYDTAGQLSSYGLKDAIDDLGFTRPDRSFVPGEEIARVWDEDRDRLVTYALDDVLDTNVLSELALPTEYYQTQLLPRGLQSVATGGPGEKINDLLVRAYVSRNHSIPLPDIPKPYPGGFTAVRATGSFGPIVKADVESLYPAIMLADRIKPASDDLDVFLPMLSVLTDRRLDAKRRTQMSAGYVHARWDGLQSSLKVLINSFYGYLGYSRGYFSDFDAARRVTERGHAIIRGVEASLKGSGARIIEIDTDGVYFEPSHDISSFDDEVRLIEGVSGELDANMTLAHDGRWARMLSLRLKNYALLGYDGRLILKGSSLRSRREEPFVRRFINDVTLSFLDPETYGKQRDLYFQLAAKIVDRGLAADEIARTETITDATFRSSTGRRLAEAVRGERIGERVRVYQRQDGSLARISEYANDEDTLHLLRRLRDGAARFRVLYDADASFDYDFPLITTNTDLDRLRESEPVSQPRLF